MTFHFVWLCENQWIIECWRPTLTFTLNLKYCTTVDSLYSHQTTKLWLQYGLSSVSDSLYYFLDNVMTDDNPTKIYYRIHSSRVLWKIYKPTNTKRDLILEILATKIAVIVQFFSDLKLSLCIFFYICNIVDDSSCKSNKGHFSE